jgi:hypothetical protein
VSAGGNAVNSLPTWAIWSIAAAALLSPVLAFLMAIAAEILIGSLMEVGVPALLAFVVAGALGCSLVRKMRVQPRGRAPIES